MSENIISWTPCIIKELPKEGSYLVTIKHHSTNITALVCFPDDNLTRKDCIAWSEAPKPYDKRRTKNAMVKWHPYPKEKPNRLSEYYLVTFVYKKKRYIGMECWYGYLGKFESEDIAPDIAWAEWPEPYKEDS